MKEEIVCPKCHSAQISANKKGYTNSTFLYGGGLLFGSDEANKVIITCLNCGSKFNPGEGELKTTTDQGEITFVKKIKVLPEKTVYPLSAYIPVTIFIIIIIVIYFYSQYK